MVDWHQENIQYKHTNILPLETVIEKSIQEHDKLEGQINVIFTSDEFLLQMNKQYLNHDFYTDIITFDYSELDMVSGDLFISIDRVRENAEELNIDFAKELDRVIIHGVLHLLGYKDKTREEKKTMTEMEDKYLEMNT